MERQTGPRRTGARRATGWFSLLLNIVYIGGTRRRCEHVVQNRGRPHFYAGNLFIYPRHITLYFDKTEKFCIGGTEGSLKDGKLVFSDKCSTEYKVKIV